MCLQLCFVTSTCEFVPSTADSFPLPGSRIRLLHDFGYVALDISSVIAEDAGVYHCRAVNALGEALSHATLQVSPAVPAEHTKIAALDQQHGRQLNSGQQDQLVADAGAFARSPAFIQHLKDCAVKELGRAHFEARVVPQGDPHLRVEWFKDGKSLNSANRIQTFQVGDVFASDISSVSGVCDDLRSFY